MVAPFVPPAVHTLGVVVVNDTARPDDAVADIVSGDCATWVVGGCANAIVCVAWLTLNVRVIDGAGA
jgi:hypothetical protein